MRFAIRYRSISAAALAAAVMVAGLSSLPATAAEPDTTAPDLVSLSLLTPTVDTTRSGATARFTIAVTDDLSGIRYASVTLTNATTGSVVIGTDYADGDGVLTATLEVSADVQPFISNGTYDLTRVDLGDRDVNNRSYDAAELADLGFSAQVQVTGPQDTTPPTVIAHTFAPSPIDVWKDDPLLDRPVVREVVGGRDDQSGVAYITPYWRSPSGKVVNAWRDFVEPDTAPVAYWGFNVYFGRDSELGVYTLDRVDLTDGAGNKATVTGAELQAQGIPIELTVLRSNDEVPPELVDAETTPTTVDTSTGPATVEMKVRLFDELSAPDDHSATGTFRGPDGTLVTTDFVRWEGTKRDPTQILTAEFPQGSAEGDWELETLTFFDYAGNVVILGHDELVRRHQPVDVAITSADVALPGGPSASVVRAGNESITVSWEPPADTGSGPITLYSVSVSDERGYYSVTRVSPSTRSVTVSGLRNDVEYYAGVSAHNRFGTGGTAPRRRRTGPGVTHRIALSLLATVLAAALVGVAPVGAAAFDGEPVPQGLSAPRNVVATAGVQSATVTWDPPEFDGGQPIAVYLVSYATFGPYYEVPADVRTFTVPDLLPGLSYRFSVEAGYGRPPAGESNEVTPLDGSGVRPTQVRATPQSDDSVLVSWRRPPTRNGPRIVGYIVTPYLDGRSEGRIRFDSTTIRQRIDGLSRERTYVFTVRAVFSDGRIGDASTVSSPVLVTGRPSEPTRIVAKAGGEPGTAVLTWRRPADSGSSPVTAYRITVYGNPFDPTIRTVTVATHPTWLRLTGLPSGSIVDFSVSAENASGSTEAARSKPITIL